VQTRQLKRLLVLLLGLAIGSVSGCGSIGTTEVILIPTTVDVDGVPYTVVRLGEDVRAKVYVEKGTGFLLSTNRVLIKAGWLLIPPPPPEGDDR